MFNLFVGSRRNGSGVVTLWYLGDRQRGGDMVTVSLLFLVFITLVIQAKLTPLIA